VVELGHGVKLLFLTECLQHVEKLTVLCYPGRENHRHPGGESDEIELGQRRQLFQIVPDKPVFQHQHVPAGQEHIVDLGMSGYVFQNAVEAVGNLIVGEPHKPFAEAVTAIHGAPVCGEYKSGPGVLVLEAVGNGV
jgi:hypothetical protein